MELELDVSHSGVEGRSFWQPFDCLRQLMATEKMCSHVNVDLCVNIMIR